jgi:hypothetical protein
VVGKELIDQELGQTGWGLNAIVAQRTRDRQSRSGGDLSLDMGHAHVAGGR